ncbi:unnamed protein product [Periconia digitata]|uniref:Uncharacterized protein n=1 Tax=Periconia digitata TaxID=1303443 RepID=A0A9W4UDL4_9PLEO|nr:unnamed protein product [Periconia digitata]
MFFNSLVLLASVAQAAILSPNDNTRLVTSDRRLAAFADPIRVVNGTITSFTVTEGTGCTAGTYHTQPYEPGKSANTYVDIDNFVYNSTTSSEPATCGFEVGVEFVVPDELEEGGELEVILTSAATTLNEYEAGDETRETNFNYLYSIYGQLGSEILDTGILYTRVADGPDEPKIAAGLYTTGVPGETVSGTFRIDLEVSTAFGEGEQRVSRFAMGWALYPITS